MSLFGKVWKSPNKTSKNLEWKLIEEDQTLLDIIELSKKKPVVIFKHSISCSISAMAKNRLEKSWEFEEKDVEIYYLDLIRYRSISNKIADLFQVIHQSPQLLVIRNGNSVLDVSHNAVSSDVVRPFVQN